MGFSRKPSFKMNEEDKAFLKRIMNDELTPEEEAELDEDFSSLDTRTHEELLREARLNKDCIDFPTRTRY